MAKRVIFLTLLLLLLPSSAYGQDIVNVKKGQPAPFEGVLLTVEAAAKVMNAKKLAEEQYQLDLERELTLQQERFNLELSYKQIELDAWKERYNSMLVFKNEENIRLQQYVMKQKPGREPWLVALGFGVGTLTSLGIFAASTEIAKQ